MLGSQVVVWIARAFSYGGIASSAACRRRKANLKGVLLFFPQASGIRSGQRSSPVWPAQDKLFQP